MSTNLTVPDGCTGYVNANVAGNPIHHEGDTCPIHETGPGEGYEHPAVGVRVRLVHNVDRYPHFVAPGGARGTIVYADRWSASVRMDDHLEGAEDWDNEVCWYAEDSHFRWGDTDPLTALAHDCAPLLEAAREENR